MTPHHFIIKWKKVELSERSAAQQHFLDLCEVFEHPKPADVDPTGDWFTFERGAAKHGGGDGWADVWKRGFFGWEYKGKHKDLDAAYDQLLQYREALENPPLLVVCDIPSCRTATTKATACISTYKVTQNRIISLRPQPMKAVVSRCVDAGRQPMKGAKSVRVRVPMRQVVNRRAIAKMRDLKREALAEPKGGQ
jgi:hypothetical protein